MGRLQCQTIKADIFALRSQGSHLASLQAEMFRSLTGILRQHTPCGPVAMGRKQCQTIEAGIFALRSQGSLLAQMQGEMFGSLTRMLWIQAPRRPAAMGRLQCQTIKAGIFALRSQGSRLAQMQGEMFGTHPSALLRWAESSAGPSREASLPWEGDMNADEYTFAHIHQL